MHPSGWTRTDVAAIVGGVMVVAGVFLAAIGRPESSLIWTGAIVTALGLLVDKIATFEVGQSGAKVTMRDVDDAKVKAKESAPVVPVAGAAPWRLSVPIEGSYWSDRAVDALVTAAGSNSRRESRAALDEFNQMIAAGTAVVQLDLGEEGPSIGEATRTTPYQPPSADK